MISIKDRALSLAVKWASQQRRINRKLGEIPTFITFKKIKPLR